MQYYYITDGISSNCHMLPAEHPVAAQLKATEAVKQTENEIFNTSVHFSAFSLQFCLIWIEKDQDLDNSVDVHVCVCVLAT